MKKSLKNIATGTAVVTASTVAAVANPMLLPSSFQLRGGISSSNKLGSQFENNLDSSEFTDEMGSNDAYVGVDLYGGSDTGWNWRLSGEYFGGSEEYDVDIDGGPEFEIDLRTHAVKTGIDVGYGFDLGSAKARLYGGASYINVTAENDYTDLDPDGDGSSSNRVNGFGTGLHAGLRLEGSISDKLSAFGSLEAGSYANSSYTFQEFGGISDGGTGLDMTTFSWNFGLGYALADNIQAIGGITWLKIGDDADSNFYGDFQTAYVGIDVDF